MPKIEDRVKVAINSARSRALIHGKHIAEYETRTKYALIDPVLGALGWNLADPAQAKFEYEIQQGRIDYALFKAGFKHPVILVEAKKLAPRGAEEFQKFSERKHIAVDQSWEQFRKGTELEKGLAPVSEEWSKILTEGNESQLGSYAYNLQLQTGYGVLTNGNEWQIYDMSRKGSFSEKLVAAFNILTDPAAGSAEKLQVLWRGNEKWPGLVLNKM